MNEHKRKKLILSAGSQWKAVDTPPDKDGWYLGSFDGALRCIGFDNGKFDFWGTPSDHRPEDLTHWTELPSVENVESRNAESNS